MTTQRLDPWGKGDITDYKNLFKEFGIEAFDKFVNTAPFSDNRYVTHHIIFAQRDFGRIAEAIEKKKRFAMMTGLMPSGKFHFGHKMVADQIIWYQKLGADVFLCSADLEAIVVRDIKPEDARKIAIEEYLTNYVALGLTEKNLTFWFQTDYKVPYYRLRDILSKKVTLNELKGIYGDDLTTGKLFSAITQAADILHTQLKEFGGPRPTIVPVGVDQDPHIRLTRDLAGRFQSDYGFISPSSTYHQFMHGLNGGKMSSSDPSSHIALTEDLDVARKKVMSAKTGGRATAKEQKELGGVPDDCMVFELLKWHWVKNDQELGERYAGCNLRTERTCGDCKRECADLLIEFLKEHQKKRVQAAKTVEKILENSARK